MTNNQLNHPPTQSAQGKGNITQVGRDYTRTTSININIWISILLVIALGSYVTLGTDLLDNFSSPVNPEILERE